LTAGQWLCPLPADCLTASGSSFFPVGPIWMCVSIWGHKPTPPNLS
ncbi:hypothetical protein STRIP9103_03083, partial [Streptomyces ipomoeae 91-03]